ncbi:Crp/Fnr family transcriptional regulator [Tellurirhabdus rosea]|uniref:Crp/Fnr family transcriptional regulator n=1 Tax=Tellurirhabdus rosea TaxID=2674997 RepID=UPI00224FDBEA|nr:Crp/Fnr family transcriptional regulator [Tellurirhabdus rosea]
MQHLLAQIERITPMSGAFREALAEAVKIRNLPRGTLLLQPGQVCNQLWFVEKGLARAFYLEEDKELTSWFMAEEEFIISVYSFFSQQPAYEFIELLEDSTIVAISFQNLQRLYDQFPEFNRVGRVLTETYYVRSEERTRQLRMQTAQERFEQLMATSPHLFNRVPLKQIASYLGMTPETLSRMRAKARRNVS